MLKTLGMLLGAVALWYVLVGAHRLDEKGIRAWYGAYSTATTVGDAKGVCNGLTSDAVVIQRDGPVGQAVPRVMNRMEYCAHAANAVERFKASQAQARLNDFSVAVSYEIESIEYSANRKRATVNASTFVSLGGGAVERVSTGTFEFVSERGRVKLARSEVGVEVRSIDRSMKSSDFFNS